MTINRAATLKTELVLVHSVSSSARLNQQSAPFSSLPLSDICPSSIRCCPDASAALKFDTYCTAVGNVPVTETAISLFLLNVTHLFQALAPVEASRAHRARESATPFWSPNIPSLSVRPSAAAADASTSRGLPTHSRTIASSPAPLRTDPYVCYV